MKLDEFIATVLQNIDSGLSQASSKTGRKYYVRNTSELKGGVGFDIAVLASNSSAGQTEGAAKAGLKVGFIEVVGANVGAKIETKEESSQVSRIQFSVYIPHKTEEEIRASEVAYRQQNHNQIEDSDFSLNPY